MAEIAKVCERERERENGVVEMNAGASKCSLDH